MGWECVEVYWVSFGKTKTKQNKTKQNKTKNKTKKKKTLCNYYNNYNFGGNLSIITNDSLDWFMLQLYFDELQDKFSFLFMRWGSRMEVMKSVIDTVNEKAYER